MCSIVYRLPWEHVNGYLSYRDHSALLHAFKTLVFRASPAEATRLLRFFAPLVERVDFAASEADALAVTALPSLRELVIFSAHAALSMAADDVSDLVVAAGEQLQVLDVGGAGTRLRGGVEAELRLARKLASLAPRNLQFLRIPLRRMTALGKLLQLRLPLATAPVFRASDEGDGCVLAVWDERRNFRFPELLPESVEALLVEEFGGCDGAFLADELDSEEISDLQRVLLRRRVCVAVSHGLVKDERSGGGGDEARSSFGSTQSRTSDVGSSRSPAASTPYREFFSEALCFCCVCFRGSPGGMEGRRIARQQNQSRGVFEALNPHRGRQQSERRNFLKEHVQAMRQKEKELKEAKQRQVEAENAPAAVNKKYAHVESRVFKAASAPQGSSAVSAASEPRSARGSAPAAVSELRHRSFGRVPEYLVEKRSKEQAEKQRQEEARRAPKIHCPPGHRILPEDERLETLALLETRKKDVEQQIQRLPLRIETDGQRRRQAELNKRFADIEQALKFLSKQNVLVKEDE